MGVENSLPFRKNYNGYKKHTGITGNSDARFFYA